jgi:hypothetical protein
MGRTERRHLLKEAEKRIGGGLDVRRHDGRDVAALMRVLHDRAELSIKRRSVRPLMEFLYSSLQAGTAHVSDVKLACARGCAHCCTVFVEASAPEVLYAVASMSEDQRARAVDAVEQACGQTGGLSFEARNDLRVPCPLLEETECGHYAARPLACRTAVSIDVEVCIRAYRMLSNEGIPVPLGWQGLRQGYSIALEGALLRAGLPHRYREWNDSLRLALANPALETQWFAGSDVFETAPSTNVPPTFNHPDWRTLYTQAFGTFP